MKATRVPVWLLTGYLGSGKTTLLSAWLRDPALADAALIINELGEVGLDDRLLSGGFDTPVLLGQSCVCCTGLPGLEEALAELFWDRLHRRRPAFGSVLIETTGLADPGPVIAAFERVELLRERYRLAGVIATASAVAGLELLRSQPEAAAQIVQADALVVTKVDRADGEPVARAALTSNPRAGIRFSAQGSLSWAEACAAIAQRHLPAEAVGLHHAHGHAAARFVSLPEALTRAALLALVTRTSADRLLRLKGVVRLDDGNLHLVQWSLGDAEPSVTGFAGSPPPLGLTCIAQE